MRTFAVAILLALCPVLAASGLKVGDRAPNFEMNGMVVYPPESVRNLSDCRGDVVFIMEWQMRDPTVGQLATVQRLWERFGGKGLHVFTIHRLNFEGELEVRKHMREKGYTFPVAMGGFEDRANDFEAYRNPGEGFRTTIVDIEGNVAFYGTDGWQSTLEREMARVRYPGLGKQTVADPADRAARHMRDRAFGRTLNEAATLLEGEISDEARADLELVIERVTAMAETRLTRVEAWLEDRRYDLALPMLDTISNEFSRHKIGDDAKARHTELRRDRDIRNELRAFEELDRLIERTQRQGDAMLVNALRAFANAQKQYRAAGVAERMAADLEYLLER